MDEKQIQYILVWDNTIETVKTKIIRRKGILYVNPVWAETDKPAATEIVNKELANLKLLMKYV